MPSRRILLFVRLYWNKNKCISYVVLIGAILKNYENPEKRDVLGRTRGFIEDSVASGAITCLICISRIKRTEQVGNIHFFYIMIC